MAQEVTVVDMESTGVYRETVLYALKHDMECQLLNPAHMRRVPGRKTDCSNAERVCQITEHGLLTPSFVPPPPIGRWRMATHYRRALVEERSRQAQHLDKALQDAGLKMSSVATDILGRSGRDIMAALVRGETDHCELAELSKGVLRKKIPSCVKRFALVSSPIAPPSWPRCWPRSTPPTRPSSRLPPPSRTWSNLMSTRSSCSAPSPGWAGVSPDHRGRDQGGHGPLRLGRAPGVLGGDVPGQQRVR